MPLYPAVGVNVTVVPGKPVKVPPVGAATSAADVGLPVDPAVRSIERAVFAAVLYGSFAAVGGDTGGEEGVPTLHPEGFPMAS